MKKIAKAKEEETKKIGKTWLKDNNNNNKKKNMQRLGGRGGGGGLSLEAFANAKTKSSNNYNPAIIKKQREFYKNAKYVSKYKRIVKQQGEPSQLEDEQDADKMDTKKKKKKKKNSTRSLREIYERKREEEDKARMETEATILARKEERQRAEARRKELREKMFKKTKSGQPVIKYRIEHILETLRGSKG